MTFTKILIFVEHILGFDFPVPVSTEKRRRDQKNIVERIVGGLSCGSYSLQNQHGGEQYKNRGLYITNEDIETLRIKNLNHNFCS